MKIYLAGPMSGRPQFNFPLFHKVSKQLRDDGWEVVSPAELDEQDSNEAASKSMAGDMKDAAYTWGHYLARDVKLIADEGIEGIIFLPGWEDSRGARLEAFVGTQIPGMKFFRYMSQGDFYTVREIEAQSVMARIATYTNEWLNKGVAR